MVEESKTTLFYILALAGLLISSILFTGRVKPLPPTPAPPTEITQEGCSSLSERNILHIPVLASLEANRLLISGAVYASDFVTPLPGALLEILSVPQETQDESHEPSHNAFHGWFQTDTAGQYKATMPKPDDEGIIHLHYRANAQDDCPLRLQLLFRDASAQSAASFSRMKWGSPEPPSALRRMEMAQRELAKTSLKGPIDVVLPVPPPISYRANLIPPGVAGEPLFVSGVVYEVDYKTPLPGALVEVWHAPPIGFYAGYNYPASAFNLGGRMRTDAAGRYEFTTLKPSSMKVGATYLPAQIHFKISHPAQKPFYTRMFFAGDPYLNNISPTPELSTQLNEQIGPTGSVWQGNFAVFPPVSTP